MAEEIWKVIPGFENYKASNLGYKDCYVSLY